MTEAINGRNSRLYWGREPVTLALLTGFGILFFLFVTALAHIFDAQQASLAERWASRGVTDLNAKEYKAAIVDFHTALLYDRDNQAYRLSLAEALLGLNRTDEASNYLVNLWARQPENGVVNLELARIAAGKGDTDRALRFYHNAIYATWPGDQDTGSRKAQLELINYLLQNKMRTQAEAETIALEANVGEDPAQLEQLGQLFIRAGDWDRALKVFRESLHFDHNNSAAEAGAGDAAFELDQYAEADRYLAAAVSSSPGDATSEQLLTATQNVLRLDPYRKSMSDAERNRAVVNAFSAAGDRLKACGADLTPEKPGAQKSSPLSPPPPAGSEQALAEQWRDLSPRITEQKLAGDSDLGDTAMNLVFQIEKQSPSTCAAPNDADKALLLIAGMQQEN